MRNSKTCRQIILIIILIAAAAAAAMFLMHKIAEDKNIEGAESAAGEAERAAEEASEETAQHDLAWLWFIQKYRRNI